MNLVTDSSALKLFAMQGLSISISAQNVKVNQSESTSMCRPMTSEIPSAAPESRRLSVNASILQIAGCSCACLKDWIQIAV